jgi:transposase
MLEVKKKLTTAVRASGTTVTGIFGVSPVVAATTIGAVRDVARFPDRDHFAAYNGIATMLIGAGEQRVHARGLAFAALGVEDNNPRARHLYQRLGYQAAGRQHASWETEDETGVMRVYETTLTILRKRL